MLFKSTDGDTTINNEFVLHDQARCQTFNIKPGVHENVSNRFYWRLVTGIGDDYIDLSKTDCYDNSDIPKAGDDIVQLGNRDPEQEERQNAIILSSLVRTLRVLNNICILTIILWKEKNVQWFPLMAMYLLVISF